LNPLFLAPTSLADSPPLELIGTAALLDTLPAGLPLSVEVPDTRRGDIPALEWAKMALAATRNLLSRRLVTR
jgi:hypothetical protein